MGDRQTLASQTSRIRNGRPAESARSASLPLLTTVASPEDFDGPEDFLARVIVWERTAG